MQNLGLSDPIPSARRDRIIVALLSLLAAVRIFVFAAAFPFFGAIDEQFHFDIVCRYSHGDIPTRMEPFSPEAARLLSMYETAEFLHRPQDIPGGRLPAPIWANPPDQRAALLKSAIENWSTTPSVDSCSPPVYYGLAGAWYAVGKGIGIQGVSLLYWIRFFNIPAYVTLVWLSYALAREIFPTSSFIYLGTALLVALFPQDVFYFINSDVLSAPLGALSLYLLLRFCRSGAPGPWLALGVGLCTAATFLTKYTNLSIVVVVLFTACAMLWRALRSKMGARQIAGPIIVLVSAALPIAPWLIRNQQLFGSLSGQSAKTQALTWTAKSLSELLPHPIFTPAGFAFFWGKLLTNFWEGESPWHGVEMSIAALKIPLVATSTLFPLCCIIASRLKRHQQENDSRPGIYICATVIALSIFTLIGLSISYDFGQCVNPSRASPYFISGRLIIAALAPFAILYLSGINVLANWMESPWLRWPLLVGIVVVVMVWKLVLMGDVLSSPYNWFHMP